MQFITLLQKPHLLYNSAARTCAICAALALRDVNSRVSRDGRGFHMERLAVVLQTLVKDAGKEDGHCGPEELQGCVRHPTIEQDFLADTRVELEGGHIWELELFLFIAYVTIHYKLS